MRKICNHGVLWQASRAQTASVQYDRSVDVHVAAVQAVVMNVAPEVRFEVLSDEAAAFSGARSYGALLGSTQAVQGTPQLCRCMGAAALGGSVLPQGYRGG